MKHGCEFSGQIVYLYVMWLDKPYHKSQKQNLRYPAGSIDYGITLQIRLSQAF